MYILTYICILTYININQTTKSLVKTPTSSLSSVAAGPDSVRVPSVHSMAAAKVQLKLLESAVFKAEQELEAMTSPEAEKKLPVGIESCPDVLCF